MVAQLNPHSIEAERLILGQAMVDNSVIDQIAQYIPEETVFYDMKHQHIWKSILSLHREGAQVIDPITVVAQIPKDAVEEPNYYLTGLTMMYTPRLMLNIMQKLCMRNGY